MRWWKHYSNLREDEQVAMYLDLCRDSLVGYGFYMTVIEVVSQGMVGLDSIPESTFPIPTWLRRCDVHVNRFNAHIELLAECELVECELIPGETRVGRRSGPDRMRVAIPRLLNWKDEYTRKSGANRDKVAAEEEQEVEQEIRKEESIVRGSSEVTAYQRREDSLGKKVSEILTKMPGLVIKDGAVDHYGLAKQVLLRERRGTREPTSKFVAAVSEAAVEHLRREARVA